MNSAIGKISFTFADLDYLIKNDGEHHANATAPIYSAGVIKKMLRVLPLWLHFARSRLSRTQGSLGSALYAAFSVLYCFIDSEQQIFVNFSISYDHFTPYMQALNEHFPTDFLYPVFLEIDQIDHDANGATASTWLCQACSV